jgi:hypothetical protein
MDAARNRACNGSHSSATDTPVETIAIYYDSYRNLVAQGVLQQPMGRRDPNPLTAFTSDP